jgi:hypothetical protein
MLEQIYIRSDQVEYVTGKTYCPNGLYIDGSLIHNNHSLPETFDEMQEEIFRMFIIYEPCGNSSIGHGISAPSPEEAIEELCEILMNEYDSHEEIHLFAIKEIITTTQTRTQHLRKLSELYNHI